MKRQITLDTETTGFNPKAGDRIVEIGLIEIIDGQKTGRVLHHVVDPQRPIPEEVVKIHGISDEVVKGKPLFKDIADEVIEFVKGAEIIIHNADFDLKFLNEEFSRAGKNKFLSYVANSRCSWELSKKLFPSVKKKKNETPEEERIRGLKHSLDDMCDRLNVDRSARVLHGALLDADLLADMFLKLNELHPLAEIEEMIEQRSWVRPETKTFEGLAGQLKKSGLSQKELENHEEMLKDMEKEKPTIFAKVSAQSMKA